MSEMALVASHLIVIGRGKILADSGIEDFIDRAAEARVRVRSPELARLQALLTAASANAAISDGAMEVTGVSIESVGEAAAANGIVLHELTGRKASLEDAFMKLTGDALDFRSVIADDASVSAAADAGSGDGTGAARP
jgi:ABC-2 type transport system ATP-binding protein